MIFPGDTRLLWLIETFGRIVALSLALALMALLAIAFVAGVLYFFLRKK